MAILNIAGLKRDPISIATKMKKSGNSVVASEELRVVFPAHYKNKGLAAFGSTVTALSIIAILDNHGNYAVVNVISMPEFAPHTVEETVIDNKPYYVMYFDKGDSVIVKSSVVKKDNFLYELFDEFLVRANIPWFMSYEDVGNLVSTARKYAGSRIGDNPIAIETIAATIARDPSDKNIFYRHAINKHKQNTQPAYVGLFDIYHTFKSTINKLTGSYFNPGITSALVNHETEDSAVERALRA